MKSSNRYDASNSCPINIIVKNCPSRLHAKFCKLADNHGFSLGRAMIFLMNVAVNKCTLTPDFDDDDWDAEH